MKLSHTNTEPRMWVLETRWCQLVTYRGTPWMGLEIFSQGMVFVTIFGRRVEFRMFKRR